MDEMTLLLLPLMHNTVARISLFPIPQRRGNEGIPASCRGISLSVDVSLFLLLLLSRLVYSPLFPLLAKVLHGLPWRRRCCRRRRRSKWIWGKVRRSGTTTGLMASIIDCIRTCLAVMGDFLLFWPDPNRGWNVTPAIPKDPCSRRMNSMWSYIYIPKSFVSDIHFDRFYVPRFRNKGNFYYYYYFEDLKYLV